MAMLNNQMVCLNAFSHPVTHLTHLTHIWRTATWRRSVSPAPWSLSWIPPSLWSSPGGCLEQKKAVFLMKKLSQHRTKTWKLWKTIMELWLWWTMIVMNDCDERLCLWMGADFGLLLQSTLRWRSSKRSREWQRSNNGVPGGQVWVAQFADLEMLCRRALHWSTMSTMSIAGWFTLTKPTSMTSPMPLASSPGAETTEATLSVLWSFHQSRSNGAGRPDSPNMIIKVPWTMTHMTQWDEAAPPQTDTKAHQDTPRHTKTHQDKPRHQTLAENPFGVLPDIGLLLLHN